MMAKKNKENIFINKIKSNNQYTNKNRLWTDIAK